MVRAVFIICTLCLSLSSIGAELIASVDRSVINMGDLFKFTLRYTDESVSAKPNFSALRKDFEILGSNTSNRINLINGKSESWVDWSLTLTPRKEGKLVIPSFNLQGSSSQAILISVKPSHSKASNNQALFFQTDLDKTEGYVQEQFLYTVKLFYSVSFGRNATLSEFKIDDALLIKLGENKNYNTTVAGVRYQVIEMNYAIFPQSSGELVLPVVEFQGTVTDPYTRRQKRVREATQENTLSVKAKPASYPAVTWLPVKTLVAQQSFSTDGELTVGEPLTRNIKLAGLGTTQALMPRLVAQKVIGAKIYPDQAKVDDEIRADGVVGRLEESQAIVPTQAGTLTVPAIQYYWWNSQTQVLETIDLPGKSFTVLAADDQISEPVAPVSSNQLNTTAAVNTPPDQLLFWQLLSAGLALSWLFTLLLWWYRGTKITKNIKPVAAAKQSERPLFSALIKACKNNNSKEVPAALLAWVQVAHQSQGLNSLNQCDVFFADAEFSEEIKQLEQSLYSQQQASPWQGKSLASLMTQLRKHQQGKAQAPAELAELYPP